MGKLFSKKYFSNQTQNSTWQWKAMGNSLILYPNKRLVWIRIDEVSDNFPVPLLLNNKIWLYINSLNCGSANINDRQAKQSKVYSFPNPAKN